MPGRKVQKTVGNQTVDKTAAEGIEQAKEHMKQKKRKIVAINKEKCKGCNFCIHVCPTGALSVSKSVNKKGLPFVVLEHPEKCTGCGMCVLMCPDFGIELVFSEE